jgi:hypothetical protein
MADPPQSPIAPMDTSDHVSADLRIEALEAMIRGLTARVEQIFAPVPSPSIIPNSLPHLPSRGTNPPPHILVRNSRFDVVLSIETYRLLDRSPVIHTDQVDILARYTNQIRPLLTDCVFSGDTPLQFLPFLK